MPCFTAHDVPLNGVQASRGHQKNSTKKNTQEERSGHTPRAGMTVFYLLGSFDLFRIFCSAHRFVLTSLN